MTDFHAIIGNDTVKNQLQLLLEKAEVPHLLLFTGIEGIGKKLNALAFASSWLQSRVEADLHLFTPEGKTGMHSIRAVKRMIDEINLTPYDSNRKAFIIADAERMLPTSANALLKTLEEPPKNTLIILVSSERQKLLSTIVSRCQEMRFCPLNEQEIAHYLNTQHGVSQSLTFARQSQGSIAKALRLAKEGKNKLEELIFGFLSLPKSCFFEALKVAKAVQQLLEARKKSYEAALKEEYGQSLKELTPAQRELVEQEMEGAISVAYFRDAYETFQLIQSYFRDLVALSCHAPLNLSHRKEALEVVFNNGQNVSLDSVARILGEAKQALERSTPIQHILETIFLHI